MTQIFRSETIMVAGRLSQWWLRVNHWKPFVQSLLCSPSIKEISFLIKNKYINYGAIHVWVVGSLFELRSNYQEWEGWDPIYRFKRALFCACPQLWPEFPTSYFVVFVRLEWEEIVRLLILYELLKLSFHTNLWQVWSFRRTLPIVWRWVRHIIFDVTIIILGEIKEKI